MIDKKGLTTFELDIQTKEVRKAEWQSGSIFISYSATEGSNTTETYILVQRPNCHYFKALNFKNAKRKALKI